MDILNWLMDNVLSILIAAGGAIAWLSERRKRKADIAGVEVVTAQGNAEVFQKMRNSYNEFVLDLNTRLDELRNEPCIQIQHELVIRISHFLKYLSISLCRHYFHACNVSFSFTPF